MKRMVIALIVVLALVALYLVTLAPAHVADMRAKPLDGVERIELGDGVAVVPPEGWLEQPYAQVAFGIGSLALVHDMSVLFGGDTGTLVKTPDGALRVEVPRMASEEEARAALQESTGEDATVITEELASGLTASHVVTKNEVVAVVETPGGPVLLRGRAADLPTYLPAFAMLLEAVTVPGDDAEAESEAE